MISSLSAHVVQLSAVNHSHCLLVVVMLGFTVNTDVPLTLMSTVVVPDPAVPAEKSAPYSFIGV